MARSIPPTEGRQPNVLRDATSHGLECFIRVQGPQALNDDSWGLRHPTTTHLLSPQGKLPHGSHRPPAMRPVSISCARFGSHVVDTNKQTEPPQIRAARSISLMAMRERQAASIVPPRRSARGSCVETPRRVPSCALASERRRPRRIARRGRVCRGGRGLPC